MTDHQRPEALRAQFDAWLSDGFPRAVERKADGEYKYMPAHSAWQAYQAGYAAAKAETADPVVGRWYFVANDGAATLCVDEADARESATEADIAFPRMAPHRAVQLVPADQLAAAVAAERERCIGIIESHDIPVGNSAAGEMACEWTYDALKTIRDALRAGAKESSDADQA